MCYSNKSSSVAQFGILLLLLLLSSSVYYSISNMDAMTFAKLKDMTFIDVIP